MKLKPCPFCGEDAVLEKTPLFDDTGHGYRGCYDFTIHCSNDECLLRLLKTGYYQTDTVYRSEEEAKQNAIDRWNNRVERKDE